MEIATLQFILTEDDLNNLIAKFVTIPPKMRDVRLRVTPDYVSLAAVYDAIFPIPFDTEWKIDVMDGKIMAHLLHAKAVGVGLDSLKGYILKALSSASARLELDGDRLVLGVDRLLGEMDVPIKTNLRSVRCEDGRLVVDCGRRDEFEKCAAANINLDVTAPIKSIQSRDDDSTISVNPNWSIDFLSFTWNEMKDKLGSAQSHFTATFISTLEFIQTADLLQWTKWLTEGAATTYDKSMDRIGEITRIYGSEHRLFDGGHTLWGSWLASAQAAAKENDDGFERLLGWGEAYIKDLTTTKGMPLVTIDKESFDQWAEALSAGGWGQA